MTVTTQTVRTERKLAGPDIPEQVFRFFAGQAERFAKPVSISFDVERVKKLSKSDISDQDAEAIAFMLWRGRVVARYAQVDFVTGLEHGWLRTELFKVCAERRKRAIAEADARRDRLNSVVFTGELPEDIQHPTKAEVAQAAKALNAS